MRYYFCLLSLISMLLCPVAHARDEIGANSIEKPKAIIYRTRKEKREAGLGTQITDWLKISGLIETQASSDDNHLRHNIASTGKDEFTTSVQLGFNVELKNGIRSEIIFDFEDKNSSLHSNLDEAFVSLEQGKWEFTVGRLYVPFGVYYSHFISGPLLEFGETRANALLVEYDFDGFIQVTGFVHEGDARKIGSDERIRDWGVVFEVKFFDEALELGAGYLSDLADSDEKLLDDQSNFYRQRVGAWNAFAVARFNHWDVSIESVWSAGEFNELDANKNEPRSWNLEVAYILSENLEFAARLESSDELTAEPEQQYGLAVNWRAHRNISIGFDYLHGEFKRGFAFDNDDNELENRDLIAARISLEF